MYFNMFTGKLSYTGGDEMLYITPDWFPYWNLEGKYVGCKKSKHLTDAGFCKPVGDEMVDVDTYGEMNW